MPNSTLLVGRFTCFFVLLQRFMHVDVQFGRGVAGSGDTPGKRVGCLGSGVRLIFAGRVFVVEGWDEMRGVWSLRW